MHLYITNIMVAMNCMGKDKYELDVVTYAVGNMDPEIRRELEASYTDHLQTRERGILSRRRVPSRSFSLQLLQQRRGC